MEAEPQIWTGQEPILHLGEGERPWTLADSFCHCLALGKTGSGKTSGPITAIMKGLLSQGVGGLWLCVKSDAADDIEKIAGAVGREDDLRFFGRDPSLCFNPIQFEAAHGVGGETVSVVELINDLMATINPNAAGEAFWQNARAELLKSAIDLLRIADREVNLENILELTASAPDENTKHESEEWRTSYCAEVLNAAKSNAEASGRERDFRLCERYFTKTLKKMGEKTRGSVISDLTGLVDSLMRGEAGRLLSSGTTISPADLADGKIIVIDFPILKYGVAGRLVNCAWKYCVQKYFQKIAGERRNDPFARPVVVACDEVQMCFLPSDVWALAVLRSAKVGVVMATQNIPNLYYTLGRDSEHAVNSALGNVGTFFMASNTSTVTAKWVGDVLGEKRVTLTNSSSTDSYKNALDPIASISHNRGISETFRPNVIQQDFLTLKTGGPENDYIVEAICVQAGREWKDGELWKKLAFDQRA